MYTGLCILIVSALIVSATAVPAIFVDIGQTDIIEQTEDIEDMLDRMTLDRTEENTLRSIDRYTYSNELTGYLPEASFGYPDQRVFLNDDEEVSEGLERTFVGITNIRAETHSIYLNVDNVIHVTVYNIGGDAGDGPYVENITDINGHINSLIEEHSGSPRVGQLEKSVEHLDEALIQVKQHQREDSIKCIRQAVVHLNAASQGRHGIPTEQIIIELGEIVRLKVYTVIDEAGRNFGSEHPDVQGAQDIYEDAVDRLDDGKYIPAMNRFRKAFGTVLGAYVCDVNIHAYSWMPDGHEEGIWVGEMEQLEAESYEILSFNWHPTVRGIHYLRFNMTGEYEVYRSPPGTEESPFRMMSFGVVVIPMADEYEYWEGGKIIDEEVEFPSEGYDSTEILMWDGNLTIKDGGALIFRDDVTFIIENDKEGDYGIHIEQGGRFVIDSPLRTTTIKTPDNDRDNTYLFHNYGTLHFTGAHVTYTYGSPDITEPGGIQNFAGSTAVLDNTTIIEANTHSVYIGEDSIVFVMGEESVIGRHDWGDTERLKGHGVFVEGATPRIRDVSVKYHQQDGIHVTDSHPMPIPARNLHEYASGDYDRQITHDGRTSTLPKIVAGNGNLYMVYLNEDEQHINFMRSTDHGLTWTETLVVPGSDIEEGYIGNIDFAADDDNLAVAWEVWYEAFPDDPKTLSVKIQVQYSSDRGLTWADEPYPIGLSHSPSVEVEGKDVYVVYVYRPWPPLPITGAVRIMWTGTHWDENGEYEFDLIEGVPKIAVVGSTIHTVIAEGGNIYYTRSDDFGDTWTDLSVISEYYGDMSYGHITMDANEYRLYIIWSSYNPETNSFEIYGKFASFIHTSEGVWVWSDDILISTESTGDSQYPEVSIDTDGNWYVVWQEIEGDISRIRYSVLNIHGEIVIADTCLTPDISEATRPSITIDSEGYGYVVRSDGIESSKEIFIKQQKTVITNTSIDISRRITENGIALRNSQGAIVSHNRLWRCRYGIQIHLSDKNFIGYNSLNNCVYGLTLRYGSNDNTLYNNTVSDMITRVAILIDESENNVFINNTMFNSGIFIMGEKLSHWNTHEIETWNTVNNKPVYYWANRIGGTVPTGAGQVILANSTDITVDNQDISLGCVGIALAFSDRNQINNGVFSYNADGIILFKSHDNTISNNIVLENPNRGIFLFQSDRNIFENNIQVGSYFPGILVTQSNNNNISNNTVHSNCFYGILLLESTSNNIINNTATFNSLGTGSGIVLLESNYNTVSKNWAAYNGYGIWLILSHDNYIINNNASDNYFTYSGIHLDSSDRNTIVDNIANANNYAGIHLHYSDNNIISNNTASENKPIFYGRDDVVNGFGIRISNSNDNIITGNTLSMNRRAGIFLSSSYNQIITRNVISFNGFGIGTATSFSNIIYNNNLLFNEIQAWDNGKNLWDSGTLELGGNYWSDYKERYPDAKPRDDTPWIWDTPYEISGSYNEDKYPLVNPAGELLKFEIPLPVLEDSDGWLFLSFPIVPMDPTVPNVLRSIEGSFDKVQSFQSAREEILHIMEEDSPEWRTYEPDRPDHYNTLKVLNNTHGFWIRMTKEANLTVYGYAPEIGSTALVLEPGWNMVGYPSLFESNNNLPEEVDRIGYFDETEEYNLAYDYDPENFVFVPGQGYWIHNPTEANIVWTVDFILILDGE